MVADSGGRTLISVAVDFADGGGAVSFALPDGVERADGLQVRLDVADDLSWDNQLELSRVEVRRSRVGYVGRRDEDLQWLLPLTGADVVTAEDADDLPADVDVTFFVDRLPGATFRGAAVVVNPAGPVGPVVPGEYEADAAILTVADSGLGGVLPEEVAVVRRWRSATLGPGVQVVLKDRQSGRPVVVRYLTPGGMVLVVLADLDPGVTDWASRPSYAVFWSAVLGELTPRAARRLEYRAADGEWASRDRKSVV